MYRRIVNHPNPMSESGSSVAVHTRPMDGAPDTEAVSQDAPARRRKRCMHRGFEVLDSRGLCRIVEMEQEFIATRDDPEARRELEEKSSFKRAKLVDVDPHGENYVAILVTSSFLNLVSMLAALPSDAPLVDLVRRVSDAHSHYERTGHSIPPLLMEEAERAGLLKRVVFDSGFTDRMAQSSTLGEMRAMGGVRKIRYDIALLTHATHQADIVRSLTRWVDATTVVRDEVALGKTLVAMTRSLMNIRTIGLTLNRMDRTNRSRALNGSLTKWIDRDCTLRLRDFVDSAIETVADSTVTLNESSHDDAVVGKICGTLFKMAAATLRVCNNLKAWTDAQGAAEPAAKPATEPVAAPVVAPASAPESAAEPACEIVCVAA